MLLSFALAFVAPLVPKEDNDDPQRCPLCEAFIRSGDRVVLADIGRGWVRNGNLVFHDLPDGNCTVVACAQRCCSAYGMPTVGRYRGLRDNAPLVAFDCA